MVKVLVGPEQELPFVKVGVTIIVAIIGAVPEFKAVKAAISPDPLPPNPIVG